MGLYSTSQVDRIAREVVTEAMVDYAIVQSFKSGRTGRSRSYYVNQTVDRWLSSPGRRAHVRRNIAIGIQCGSYSIAVFEAEQALRCLAPVKA